METRARWPGVVHLTIASLITATAVSGKVASNQATRAQQTAASPAPDPGPVEEGAFTDDAYEQLEKLGELREAGILTEEEFQAKKTQILAI
jgi:hypothetical protein